MGNRKEGAVALPSDLKRRNYFSILNTFRSGKAMSANDISEKTGISRQTVMKAINHFMEKKLLISVGKGESTEIGGKKPELFQFGMKRYLLCIGLDGDEMAACIYDLTSTLLAKEVIEYQLDASLEEFLQHMDIITDKLLDTVEQGRERLYGVSLFIGGILESETGILRHFALSPEWGKDIPLKELLGKRFPTAEIVVENVAHMAACAAVLDNSIYETCRVAVIYTDRGISASYIDKGQVLHGANTLIGEIGTMVLALNEAEEYCKDEKSYFSYLAGERYLRKQSEGEKELFQKSTLSGYGEKLSIQDIFKEAEEGDILARKIVKKAAWTFSAALYNVMLSFEPEVVIFQGNYAHAGAWFDSCVKEGLQCFPGIEAESFMLQYDKRPVIDLQMMGATKLLTRRFFQSPEWL